MDTYAYPTSFDSSQLLLGQLGTHWDEAYSGKETLLAYLDGKLEAAKQAQVCLEETANSLSRYTVPVYHKERWYLLTLKESERNVSQSSILRYGDGAVYGNQPTTGVLYTYGVPNVQNNYEFPLPDGIVSLPTLSNRITLATKTLFYGIDYYIDLIKRLIVFKADPFENDNIPQREVFSDGEVADREVGLWASGALIDTRNIYKQWGYAFGFRAESSPAYRYSLNALASGIVDGGTKLKVMQLLSGITGIPLAGFDGEVVEDISEDNVTKLVITDQGVYKISKNLEITVTVGDTLNAGDELCDGLKFYEFNRGQVPSDIQAICMGPELLSGQYTQGVVFSNKTTSVVVGGQVDGKTKLSFELGGKPAEVEQFWDTVHSNGVAAGTVLADVWDITYPATVNPMEFAISNILRNNAFAVKIKVNGLAANNLGLAAASQLRKFIHPHTMLMIFVELETELSEIVPDQVVDGITGIGMEVLTIDEDLLSLVSIDAEIEYLDDNCAYSDSEV